VAFVSCFFVLFGSFIKIGLNLDLFVQPAPHLFIEVSKWLSSFFKAMFPVVNDLWVSKLKKADVPCISSWILNDSTGVV
jgi:hypothetical protein